MVSIASVQDLGYRIVTTMWSSHGRIHVIIELSYHPFLP